MLATLLFVATVVTTALSITPSTSSDLLTANIEALTENESLDPGESGQTHLCFTQYTAPVSGGGRLL